MYMKTMDAAAILGIWRNHCTFAPPIGTICAIVVLEGRWKAAAAVEAEEEEAILAATGAAMTWAWALRMRS